jgi:hypothetical protein
MAEIKIKGQTYDLSEFKGLEGDALDKRILGLKGVGEKTLPSVRGKVLSAVADAKTANCHNFKKCGNQAEAGHEYCSECHLTWRRKQVSQEDRDTRPLRVNVQEQLDKDRGFYVRYYKDEKPAKWPQEVRDAFLTAEAAIAEGDRLALEAVSEGDPNPGLFRVARWNYFQVRNHLAVAQYHQTRISTEGVLNGLSNFAQRQLGEAMAEAEKAMRAAEKLDGYKKTRQLQDAARAMLRVLSSARKERDSMKKVKAGDFYGGAAIGDFLSDDQVKKLNRQHKRSQKAKAHSK